MKFFWILPILFVFHQKNFSQKTTLFSSLSSSQTGITFINQLKETPQFNIITYEYFYNGGGVALGDFNNDGLTDIYLTANMMPNKLYLNKGNWQFEDITLKAGVAGKPGWKTGVSIADVNGDGYLDIYVCYSGPFDRKHRTNQLFINNGNLTFTEKAEQMGVADSGYSTQAVFFDYDRDGDLDLFVINHNNKNLRNFDAAFVKKMVDADAGDRLYRNDGDHFTDVTLQAGIISNPLGYGLGVSVSDVNNDGWPDLYVTNDYVEEDYLYINNKNGTFTEKIKDELGHLSNFSMGVDIADINNDGLPDIFTLDMLPADNKRQKQIYTPDNFELYNNAVQNGFYHQLMRNMLQVNNGDNTFSETGQLSGVYCTDWSWACLFADFDNDGYKDLFVTNGYGRDMTNRDFVKFYADQRLKYLKGENDERMFGMLQSIPVSPLHNYIFKNNGNLKFGDSSLNWGFDQNDLSQGAAYADLDNDGDLDLVINRLNAPAALYRNMLMENQHQQHYLRVNLHMDGKNRLALGAKVFVYTPAGNSMIENYPVHGFQSSMQSALHFGLASPRVDSIVVQWPDGDMQTIHEGIHADSEINISYVKSGKAFLPFNDTVHVFKKSAATIPFHFSDVETNDFKTQPLMPNMISYNGPRYIKADVNGDGLDDLFVCGGDGNGRELLIQQKDGSFSVSDKKVFEENADAVDADAIFFDADNDGDPDLYIVGGGYHFSPGAPELQDRLYINVNGSFHYEKNKLPVETSSGSCVRATDIDGDGDLDLFVGGRVVPGRYPEPPESFILINDGKGNFINATADIAPELKYIGMVTDAAWVDLNKDGKNDLVICGEWMGILVFENENGKLVNKTGKYFTDPLKGWWNRLCFADVDGDGDMDLIAGNWGTNSAIYAKNDQPVTLYYDDFDDNGSIDPLMCYYIKGKSWPMASRDEITDQMVNLRKKFPTYDSYSEATINDILSPEQIKNAKGLSANHFETSFFENKNGVFVYKPLPVQANYAPVYAIDVDDYDHDGKADILLAGNIEHTKVRTGRMDANYGIMLRGNGKCDFTYVPQTKSGLCVKGCVRDMVKLNTNNGRLLVFAVCNNNPAVYQLQ